MDMNVPKLGFKHVSHFMSRRGSAYTAATRLPFTRPVPTLESFMDTWRELATPIEIRPPRPTRPPVRVSALGPYNCGPSASNHITQ